MAADTKEVEREMYCPHCDEWYPETSWEWTWEKGCCPDCGQPVLNPKVRNVGQESG